MRFEERVAFLEQVHDWSTLAEEVERAIGAASSNDVRGALHLRLGLLYEEKFLAVAKALKQFQDAYKLEPTLVSSLMRARHIYWLLGKMNMVVKLADLELKAWGDKRPPALFLEQGDILSDVGDHEGAKSAYDRAIGGDGAVGAEARAALGDLLVNADSWQDRVLTILAEEGQHQGPARARLFLRAARIAKRFAPSEAESFLARAYATDPEDLAIATAYESIFVEAGRLPALEARQNEIIDLATDERKGRLSYVFGVRWLARHQVADVAARLLEAAILAGSDAEAAFLGLEDSVGRKGGDWARVAALAERALTVTGTNEAFFLSEAGAVQWRQIGNVTRARELFTRLAALHPEHPRVVAFETQIGASLRDAPPPAVVVVPSVPPAAVGPAAVQPRAAAQAEPEPATAVASETVRPVPSESTPRPSAVAAAPADVPVAVEHPQAPAAPPPPLPAPPADDEAKLAELRALAVKQEGAKRFNEFVKTLLQLAAIVPSASEKVDLYMRAADVFATKFANQAEAVKAYEAVIAIDPDNAIAVDFLKQMYEKRRDWEKLLGLQRREADTLEEGAPRAARYLEIARLATERVKRPEVCSELWRQVVQNDPNNVEALSALVGIYERTREFQHLADALSKQVQLTDDVPARILLLSKLAAVCGDKLNDEEGSVAAWKELLFLDPKDRRAQDALKKKFLTLGRWDELDVFYEESGKWDELIRLLEQQESKETRPESKLALALKIARLWLDKKQKQDRASKLFERALELDPQNLVAADALIPIYTTVKSWKALAAAIDVKLNHEQDPAQRAHLLRETGRLFEGPLGSPATALERYNLAFDATSGDEETSTDLERAAKATGAWDVPVAAYRRAAEAAEISDDATQLRLRLRLGRVLFEEKHDATAAISEYETALRISPTDHRAIGALERLYAETGRYGDLLALEQGRLSDAPDAETRRHVLLEIGQLQRTHLKAPTDAIETYQSLLADSPDDSAALEALDSLYLEEKMWVPYAETLRRRLETAGSSVAVTELRLRLGTVLRDQFSDFRGALECFREVLVTDPQNADAAVGLESLLTIPEIRVDAAATLEGVYEHAGSFSKLVRVLDILAADESDALARIRIYLKSARVYADMLGDARGAFQAFASALRLDPSDESTRGRTEQAAEASEAVPALSELYSEIAEACDDGDLRRMYLYRRGRMLEAHGDIDGAVSAYEHLLTVFPDDEATMESLALLFERTERWSSLIALSERRAELAMDGSRRGALLTAVARLYDTKIGQLDLAVACYRRVLEGAPESREVLTALEDLLSRQEKWDELDEVVVTQVSLASGDHEQISTLWKLSQLREFKLGRVSEAVDGYREIVERDPSNGVALAALERIGQTPEYELSIGEILDGIYRRSGDYRKLIGVQEVFVRRNSQPPRRAELLQQVAELYEVGMADRDAAAATLLRALREDPGNERTQQLAEQAALRANSVSTLATEYELLAAGTLDVPLAIALYGRAAMLREMELGELEFAGRDYRAILALDPRDLTATEALERLLRGQGQFAPLAALLDQKASAFDDVQIRKAALFDAAAIHEETLGDISAAITALARIFEMDPDDVRAVDALISRFSNAGRFTDLLSVLAKKIDLVGSVDEKKRYLDEIGRVHDEKLGDASSAVESYLRILELDPDDRLALDRLAVLYERKQQWGELVNVLARKSELASSDEEVAEIQHRIASVYAEHLGDVTRAIEIYREILQRVQGHAATIASLEALKNDTRDPLGAADVLEPVYTARGEWAPLVGVLEVRIGLASDPFDRVELLRRVAAIQEDAENDRGAAFRTYARAFAADPANEDVIQSLERLALDLQAWDDLLRIYDAQIELASDSPDRLVAIAIRAAQIREVQVERPTEAISTYRRILSVDSSNLAAVRALDRLYTATAQWSELVGILERENELGETPAEILDARYRLGRVHEQHRSDVPAAISLYRDIVAAAPEHTGAMEALESLFERGIERGTVSQILEPIYRQFGEWKKLAQLYATSLKDQHERGDRLATYARIREVYEEGLASPPDALHTVIAALKEYPDDADLAEEAARLAGAVDGGWEAVAGAYADVVEAGQDPKERAHAGVRLAHIFEERLGDVAKAEEAFRYVLSISPSDSESLSNLDRIYTTAEAWPELSSILDARVAGTTETSELVDLLRRQGEVYETRLHDEARATAPFRRIIDSLDRHNEPALDALARIYEHAEAWDALVVIYTIQLEVVPGDSAEAEVRAKIARLSEDRLSDLPAALKQWKVILDLRGEDPEALAASARLLEKLKDWSALEAILERQCDVASTDEERVGLVSRRARVFEEGLGDSDRALAEWMRVAELEPTNAPAYRAIAKIQSARGDTDGLVQTRYRMLDNVGATLEADESAAILREIAVANLAVLGRPDDAIDAWQRLLQFGPDTEAFDSLERIFRDSERWEDVVGIKLRRARSLEEPADKVRELFAAAALWEEPIGNADGARPIFEEILELDATSLPAFTSLERLHTEAARWEPLVELYLLRLEACESGSDKARLLRNIARVFEEHLEDKNQALDALINALSNDVHDKETVREIERLALSSGRWNEVIHTVAEWLRTETDRTRTIRLCLLLAKWYGEELGHPEYAQPYLSQVIRLDGHNVGAMRQLASLYRRAANWQQAGSTLSAALEVAASDADRKEILHDLGDLLHTHMGQTEQAIVYFRRALDVDPSFVPALDSLERVYTAGGNERDLIDVLVRKASIATVPADVVAAKLRIGQLYETVAHDLPRAAQTYRDVIEIDRDNRHALRGLARVLEGESKWQELLSVLERELEAVTTERERIDVLTKIASIQEEQFLKYDQAAENLEKVLEIDPNDERAYAALARAYRKLRRFPELVTTYDRHIAATSDKKTRVSLYEGIASVYANELGDAERAIDGYKNILDIDERQIGALEALGRLYEKVGDTQSSLDYMARVAELTEDPKLRVEAFFRIGRALDEKLGDKAAAQDRYELTLDIDPNYVPAMTALKNIALENGDFVRAARYLDREQAACQMPRQRAKLLVELGRIRQEMIGDHAAACEAWETAIGLDDENEEAAVRLVDEYLDAEKWAKSLPLLDMLIRKSGKREPDERRALQMKLARACVAEDKLERAFRAFEAAHEIDSTDKACEQGLGDVAFRLRNWDAALTSYQRLVTMLDADDASALANAYYRIGAIRQEQGQQKHAIAAFDKALSVDPSHRETLDAIVTLYASLGDWKQVAAYKRQILDNVFDGEERCRILGEIADVWTDKEKNIPKAIDALEEARDIQPTNNALIHQLIALYQATSNWGKMIDALGSIADREKDPVRKSKIIYAIAQLYRDNEDNPDKAVELFGEALDLNPQYLEAFERINKILTTKKDWKALERAFRKMLRRLSMAGSQNPELEFNLWHNLGLIYRDRLKDLASSIEAFKMACRFKPDEAVERQILAELYEATDQLEAAVGEHTIVLQREPMRLDPYRNLYRLYTKSHEYDRAWCMSAALSFLQKSDDDERKFFEEYRPRGMIQVKSRLDNEQWVKLLFHKDENLYIGKIFQMITPAALEAKLAQLRASKQLPMLDKKFKQDPATSTVTLAKTFGWASHVLGITMPELYVRTDVPGALAAVPSSPPATVAGQTILTGFSPQELTFIIGKHLAQYRGEHYIRTLFPTLIDLKVLLFAAIKLVIPEFAVPAEMAQAVGTAAAELGKYVQAVHKESLRIVVQKFVEEGAKADLKRWMQAVDITSCRAGLTLCGDLEIAKKVIAAEPQLPGDLTPSEKMKELLVFAVSEQYYTLRKALGVAIG